MDRAGAPNGNARFVFILAALRALLILSLGRDNPIVAITITTGTATVGPGRYAISSETTVGAAMVTVASFPMTCLWTQMRLQGRHNKMKPSFAKARTD